ncbi:MAG: sigma-70 family RNA polymerase sigma factor, partial [Alteraurantiacibacter sp.]
LARRWHPRLLRTARRMLGEADAAQGVTQEAWLGIQRGIHRLSDPARFGPWAFGILRRKCVDEIRKRQSQREPATADVSLAAPTDTTDSLAIAQAFATLPPEQRLAAHLFFVEGFTLAKIAEAQDIPEGTAKSRLFHARRKLKAALSGDNP